MPTRRWVVTLMVSGFAYAQAWWVTGWVPTDSSLRVITPGADQRCGERGLACVDRSGDDYVAPIGGTDCPGV
ncbi:MAG: hypothetical protein V9F03_05515 [Microthrixaceae bacterium]